MCVLIPRGSLTLYTKPFYDNRRCDIVEFAIAHLISAYECSFATLVLVFMMWYVVYSWPFTHGISSDVMDIQFVMVQHSIH